MDKLGQVQEIARNRAAVGWEPLLPDESWMFMTMGDERVCPVCGGEERKIARFTGYREHKVYQGSAIPGEFPFYNFETPTLIRPLIHNNCRCRLEWIDPVGTLQRRLHAELVTHG